jgi:hypothetical protein
MLAVIALVVAVMRRGNRDERQRSEDHGEQWKNAPNGACHGCSSFRF